MNIGNGMMKRVVRLGLLLMLGASMCACSTSWKEEVLLHDGSKVIVERSQSYGGRHEIGQPSPIKEHTISFKLLNGGKAIKWTSEYSEDIGRANLNLLALHVLNGVPYIVATPNLCLSYNKWGRPNPPYVFFKHDGKEWQRITLQDLPVEFKTVNIDFGMPWDIRDRRVKFDKGGLLTAETIRRHNEESRQPEYKTILREALPDAGGSCIKTDYYKGYGWLSTDWFTDQPSLEACLRFCGQKKIANEACPCNKFFKGEK